MTIDDFLTKAQAVLDTCVTYKSRVISTVTYADKILGACLDASTGDEEKKIFGGLKAIADKLLLVLS